NRFSVGPTSTHARLTRRLSASPSSLPGCWPFATADRSTFCTTLAAARGVKRSKARASLTGHPLIRSTTGRVFRGDIRTKRSVAFDSVIAWVFLFEGHGFFALGGPVPLEEPRRRKLAQLVSDHVLGDVNRNELFAVVNGQRVADHFGHDRGAARPRLEDLLLAAGVHVLDPALQTSIDERAFGH